MDIILNIVFKSLEILTLICGLLGLVLSLLLMAFPEKIKYLSDRFNRNFDVDAKLNFLDINVQTGHLFYRHHILAGIILIAGSSVLLAFLYSNFDPQRFVRIFVSGYKLLPISEIVLQAAMLIGKLAGLAGLVVGFILVFAVDKLESVDAKIAAPVVTKPFFDKLNTFHPGIDKIFLKYPVFFGMIGLIASVSVTFMVSLIILNANRFY